MIKKITEWAVALFVGAIAFQFAMQLLAPYMHFLGLTLAIVITFVIIGSLFMFVFVAYRRYFGGGGSDRM